jgi:hypothetical protein
MTKCAQMSLFTLYAGLQIKMDGGVYRNFKNKTCIDQQFE